MPKAAVKKSPPKKSPKKEVKQEKKSPKKKEVKKEVKQEKKVKDTPVKKEKLTEEEKEEKRKRKEKERRKKEKVRFIGVEGDDGSDEDPDKEDKGSDSDDDEEDYKWWTDPTAVVRKKGEQQWTTLKHNGPVFPDPYVVKGVPLLYAGKEITLSPEEEEYAFAFGGVHRADQYYKSQLFRKNFWGEFKAVLDKNRGPNHEIQELALCDFSRIIDKIEHDRAIKNNRSSEEKKKEKLEKEKKLAPYKTCLWDGKPQNLSNPTVEPPGLFRGRGKHPAQGKMKKRVQPEDITINIGPGEKAPAPPAGRQWKAVVNDNTVTWMAYWQDALTKGYKYIQLATDGFSKQIMDREKFNKARRLKAIVDKVRESYRNDWKSNDKSVISRGVATYFIDKLALRVGNEKGEEEADTVGCCSLKIHHVTPRVTGDGKTWIHFDFLGKDSIRYENTVEVDKKVHELVTYLRAHPSGPERKNLFDTDPGRLNDYLKEFSPDLSAKVFRTYNASFCLDKFFRENPMPDPKTSTVGERVVYFNQANAEVAILCNHQKTVSKGHLAQMDQLEAKKKDLQETRLMVEKLMKGKNKNKAQEAYNTWYEGRLEDWAAEGAPEKEKNKWIEKYGRDPVKRDKREREGEEEDDEDETLAEVVSKKKGGKKASPAKDEEEDPSPRRSSGKKASPKKKGGKK